MPLQLVDLMKVFWIAFAASAIVAWPIYRWLKSTVGQKIDPHAPESHQAKQGTPTMGGLIILVGSVVGVLYGVQLVFGGAGKGTPVHGVLASQIPGFLTLLIGFAVIGFVDDFVIPRAFAGKRGLGWRQKLLLEVAVAVVGVYLVYAPVYEPLPLIIGVFLVLSFSNAFNFTDGLDGLAGSVWIALSVGIALLAFSQPTSTAILVVTLATLGACIPFLFLNAPPAKVFMGDAGSLPLGAVLGLVVTVMLWPYQSNVAEPFVFQSWLVLPLVVWSFLMIAELLPVPMQVAFFKLTKGKRLFPMTPIHHAFEKKGWPESRVVWSFALVQLLLSIAAVTIASFTRVNADFWRLY